MYNKFYIKKNLVSILLFSALVLFSCASPPYNAERVRRIPEDFFGIASFRTDLNSRDFELLDELGVVWQRRTCRWGSLERERGVWDFSSWDAYVSDSRAAGKKNLAILAYDTAWLHGENGTSGKINSEELPLFINYVEQVVTRYRGQIEAYEIWNEPNWISWKGSKKEFIELTLAAAKKIREIDPQAKILAGAFWRVPASYIRQLFSSGVMDYVDAVSFHPYAVNPSGSVKLFDNLAKILDEFSYRGEIWVTEVGYPTSGWYPTTVKEKDFPGVIIKTLAGLAIRDIKVLLWYELKDAYNRGEAPSKTDSEYYFGISYLDHTKKNGFNAWALCGQNLAGTYYRPDWPAREGLPDRTVSLCFEGREKNVLILWNESGGEVRARANLPGTNPVIYDISTGLGRIMDRNEEILITKEPVFITWSGNAWSRPLVEKL